MIYIHEYYTGKFNSVKHVRVYDTYREALNQQEVLGGIIQCCEIVYEI